MKTRQISDNLRDRAMAKANNSCVRAILESRTNQFKKVFFIRHAESLAQLGQWEKWGDSPLSALGTQQAMALAQKVTALKLNSCKVYASPLTRAALTALHAFREHPHSEIRLLPVVAEDVKAGASVGQTARELRIALWNEFPGRKINFELLGSPDTIWWDDIHQNGRKQMEARVPLFKEFLTQEQKACLVVVSHSGFLRALIGHDFFLRPKGLGPNNTEVVPCYWPIDNRGRGTNIST